MQRIASSLGYRTGILLTANARADVILSAIRDAAAQLQEGDTFLVTYAGHGAQVVDASGDEVSGQDSTWCVYDRMIIDDELGVLWPLFKKGVFIVIVSDSCHSGTVWRPIIFGPVTRAASPRLLGKKYVKQVYQANKTLYDRIRSRAIAPQDISAGLILLAACKDDQVAADGDGDGLFTEQLLKVWNDGRFQGAYPSFMAEISLLVSASTGNNQRPQYSTDGAGASFESRRPFEISPADSQQTTSTNTSQGTCTKTIEPTQQKEDTMATYIDNGNWDEVLQALSQQASGSRGGVDFVPQLIAAKKQAAEAAYFGPNGGGQTDVSRGLGGFATYW